MITDALELAADLADVHVEAAIVGRVAALQHVLVQKRLAQHFIGIAVKGVEQAKFAAGQARVLRAMAGGSTRVELLGRTLAHPILLAPVAFQRMAHPDGELAMAYAAAAQSAGIILSTQASLPMETVAQAARMRIGSLPHEEVWVAYVDNRNRLISWEKAMKGTVDASAVYPRDIMERALALKATGFIMVHNHPGGEPSPSGADTGADTSVDAAAAQPASEPLAETAAAATNRL